MSLDLWIKTKTPRPVSGTGVYVRKNGSNVELKTIEEVKEHFPDADLSEIEERMFETYEIFSGNITHNLCKMAENVKCGEYNYYQLLWHPEEHGFTEVTNVYRYLVAEGLAYLINHRKELEEYNPSNGWGSYDKLLEFATDYCKAISNWDGSETYEIHSWA